jgi:hypothetical protein
MAVRVLVVVTVILAAFSIQEYVQIQNLRSELGATEARAAASARATVADWLGGQIAESDGAIEWLHNYYKSADGLQRPQGLWIDGHPDYTAISTWVFGVYMGNRLRGKTDEQAKQAVTTEIRQSEEWRLKHQK